MLLKDLIPMLCSNDTADNYRTIRIELSAPVGYIYEGKISDFYEKYILTRATTLSYKNTSRKLGTPIGEFSVMNFTHYKGIDVDKYNVPEYNWPINIVIY